MNIIAPKTMAELMPGLERMTETGKILGGGTDYIIRLNMGEKPSELCYLGYVEELRKIEVANGEIVIGACATMTQIAVHPLIQTYLTALSDAAVDVGSLQIRNNGTIGGNIGNASPAGDLIPVLYLYEADIEIAGPEGTRIEPITRLITGPGRTALAYNEAIIRIFIRVPDYKSVFVKLGSRKKVTISRIGFCMGIVRDGDTVREARIFIGAISITPVRLTQAEAYLAGKTLNEETALYTGRILSDLIMEITPEEFDRDYKVFAARGIVDDAFRKLINTARR